MGEPKNHEQGLISHRVPSWLRPEGKAEVIQAVWGGRIPPVLCYFVGNRDRRKPFSNEDIMDAISQLFINPEGLSAVFYGHNNVWGSDTFVLGATGVDLQEAPLSIMLGKRVCPLCEAGIAGKPGYISFVNPDESEGLPLPQLN